MPEIQFPKYKIEIVPYKEEWSDQFAQAKENLISKLGNVAKSIRHIGSTSIPGLAAKDCIDIQVTIDDLSDSTKSRVDHAMIELGLKETLLYEDLKPSWDTNNESHWKKLLVYPVPARVFT